MCKPINVDGEQILESKVEIRVSLNLIIYRYFDINALAYMYCTCKKYKVISEKRKI